MSMTEIKMSNSVGARRGKYLADYRRGMKKISTKSTYCKLSKIAILSSFSVTSKLNDGRYFSELKEERVGYHSV